MHSLLCSRQGEIDGVCTQLHAGYSRCEHICARAQGNSTWTPSVDELRLEMRLTTLSLFKKKKTRLLHQRCKTNDEDIDLISFKFEL